MTHLLSFLLTGQAELPFAALVVVCAIGGIAATVVLASDSSDRRRRVRCVAAFSILGTGVNYLVFLLGLSAGFPRLSLAIPVDVVLSGLAISLVCDAFACCVLMVNRRSLRLLLLAGAMMSCGTSLTIFTEMAAMVRPFRLGYDLGVVISTGVVGAMLSAFAFSEFGRLATNRRRHRPTLLFGLATLVVTVGSLGSVLPFDQWVSVMDKGDSLAAFPITIIIAINVNLAIGMALSGWAIDSYLVRQEQRQVARVRRLADSTFEGILIHRGDRILDANETLLRMTGYTLLELRLKRVSLVIAAPATAGAGDEVDTGGPAGTELLTREGERLPVESLSREIDYVGGPARVTALRDIRERREAERRIYHLANHDALTDLANRRHLETRFEQAVTAANLQGLRVAICCIDLDGFKAVNDRYGHAAGDLLLQKVAHRLNAECSDDDLVARFGGDEFVIVLAPGDRSEQAGSVGERLVQSLSMPFELDGVTAYIGASIGLSFFPDDGDTIAALFKTADIALYRAKERGRNQLCVFDSGMDRRVLKRRAMEQDLRQAIAGGELLLHYQPLFDAANRIVAFEALVRWQHPSMGAIPPDRFVPLAERCGLRAPNRTSKVGSLFPI